MKEEMAMKQIIKVRFLNTEGEPRGREYSYYCTAEIALGDYVNAPVTPQHPDDITERRAVVSQIGVSQSEIEDFKDRMKTITERIE